MKFSQRFAAYSVLLPAALLACAVEMAAQQPAVDPLHAWVSSSNPAALESWVNLRLAEEQADVAKLLAVSGPRTVENTLRPYDDAQNQLAIAGNNASLLYSLADAAAMRDKGQALTAAISSAYTDLSLNQKVYSALAARSEERRVGKECRSRW